MRLEEIFEGEQHIYLVLTLCNGVNLLDFLKKTNLPGEQMSLQIIKKILEGVHYLHQNNRMHRDLKLENVIVREIDEENLDVLIVDFGFACNVKDYKKYFPRCGTPGYIAPEILKGKSYGLNVDVFSAGIIFYILLTLCNPFYNGDQNLLLQNNLKCKIDFNFEQKVSHFTMDLLKKMLKKSPSERISSADCLQHPCFQKQTIKNFIHADISDNES